MVIEITIILVIMLLLMFVFGYYYGKYIERKRKRGVNMKNPLEWVKP
jgi:hypothetical protein